MKKSVLFSAMGVLAASATIANAQEVGRVISSTPVIQQVAVPRQVCSNQPVVVQQPTTGAGAIMGGIAGGAIGNQIGGGGGRAAATALGLIGGAILGNNIEGRGSQVQNVQQCATQTSYENRTIGYNVRYEYAGKEYTVQMPYDPGPTIRLQVTPISANEAAPAPQAAAPEPQTYPVAQPAVVASAQPAVTAAYPVYAPAPYYYPSYPAYPYYYPPVSLSLGFGWWGGGGHWGGHHWGGGHWGHR